MIGKFANSSNLLRGISVLLFVCSVQPLMASLSYGVWVIDTSHATHDPIFADVNGDGLKDVVLPQYFRDAGRELHVYFQEKDERFSNSPLKIEIKSEAIGFALVDVRESLGTEIIWITSDAIYSFSANVRGYVGNLEHLSDWELFIRHPDSRELLYVEAIDMNGDGAQDLVLPGPSRYGIFLNTQDGKFELAGSIEIAKSAILDGIEQRVFPSRSRVTSTLAEVDEIGELSLTDLVVTRSQYRSLFSTIDRDDKQTRSIGYGSWQPGAIVRDIDGDGIVDLMSQTSTGFKVSHLKPESSIASVEARDSFESHTESSSLVELVSYEIPYGGRQASAFEDIDGDGDLDIVVTNSGITSSTVRLLTNEDGQFKVDPPAQVIRVNGTIVRVEFTAPHKEERPFMLINTVTTPLRKILTEIELHRNLLLFGFDESEQGIFNRKPTLTSTQSINIDSLRNLMPSTMRFDLDSDGTKDILECKSDGTVQARRIDQNKNKAAQPYWQFTPEFAVFSTRSDDVNNDHQTDLVLEHSTATTLLISRP